MIHKRLNVIVYLHRLLLPFDGGLQTGHMFQWYIKDFRAING